MMELKERQEASPLAEAIRLLRYCNSKSTVSYFFPSTKSLWIQTELYDKLKMHQKIQQAFINIAAQELQIPVQSILLN
jgi:hypothetical protein